jgi:putative PIN family toxin of toxin-antitoxin system
MIRVVLDTNILVSALLQPAGPSARLLTLAIGNMIQICVTGVIYAEYEEVIQRPRFGFSAAAITNALEFVRVGSLWVKGIGISGACSDPDDDIFVDCADVAQANYHDR